MITRDELLEDVEWEAHCVCGSGRLLSLKAVLAKLEWLDPFHELVADLRREIHDLNRVQFERYGFRRLRLPYQANSSPKSHVS